MDSNSLTKTNNWSGRNEVTETSGRLHPLWPQIKWLHTPRTTDHRHNRQDRRIQTELAFTLAKNSTKPNPFEIIPLQTRRKENNWKTEEALARAAVSLGTERIKGSNSWCLWWYDDDDPFTKAFSAFETFCCDKINEVMYKFKIYVLVCSVAIFYLFSFSILHWDCTVMWLSIFIHLIHKSLQRLYSTLYNDVCIMQTNDRCYVSKEAARIVNSGYVMCVFMWYSFCFQGCKRLAVSLTKVANIDVSTVYLYALQ